MTRAEKISKTVIATLLILYFIFVGLLIYSAKPCIDNCPVDDSNGALPEGEIYESK